MAPKLYVDLFDPLLVQIDCLHYWHKVTPYALAKGLSAGCLQAKQLDVRRPKFVWRKKSGLNGMAIEKISSWIS